MTTIRRLILALAMGSSLLVGMATPAPANDMPVIPLPQVHAGIPFGGTGGMNTWGATAVSYGSHRPVRVYFRRCPGERWHCFGFTCKNAAMQAVQFFQAKGYEAFIR